MLIVLEGERCWSWNKLYAGTHWSKRSAEAGRVHQLVHLAVKSYDRNIRPFDYRVAITVRAFFDKRPLDPCNIPAKLYIDGLLKLVIHDDNMKYVRSVTTESHIDKKNPRVEIEIEHEL